MCAGCLVRAECLAEALARIPYGIAGGLTPQERRTGVAAGAEAQLLARGLRPGALRREVSAAGLVLLAAGRSPAEVASRCGVHLETVRRWRLRQAADSAEGSAGGNRAPLLISHTSDPLAGTPTQEGGRV